MNSLSIDVLVAVAVVSFLRCILAYSRLPGEALRHAAGKIQSPPAPSERPMGSLFAAG